MDLSGHAREKRSIMENRFVDILCKQFPTFSRNEIVQEILLAELGGREGPLSFVIAQRQLTNKVVKEQRLMSRFLSFQTDEIGVWGDLLVSMAAEDPIMAAFMEEEEWQTLLQDLPYPARKLAEFARKEAESFENVPEGIWTRGNITEIRRRVKRDWIAWDRNHSERAYKKTKRVLISVLRRHRRFGKRGEGGQCYGRCHK